MPPRHRQARVASSLSQRRLPVGTPRPPSKDRTAADRSSTQTLHHSSDSFSGFPSVEDCDSPTAAAAATAATAFTTVTDTGDVYPTIANMSNNGSSGSTVLSLAEAKLARQNARIQQAEAALTAPVMLKRGDLERGNMPQPVASRDASRSQERKNAALRASEPEVRVNTFRAPPRDPSLDRSMSSLSQRTTGTQVSDHAPIDNSGFQVFTGRRSKKVPEMLNAYEDKPEQKQTTVEATVDIREIHEVFGNALPGTDYIQQNLGTKDGQLQFLQHPNGDVSAHQWSMERFVWENIGQFSNIRKRIEGLLATDRLRGETAHRNLQHNTLAYFRAIARQREALSLGQQLSAANVMENLPKVQTGHSDVANAVRDNASTGSGRSIEPSESHCSTQSSNEPVPSAQQHDGVPQHYHYPGCPPYTMPAAYAGYHQAAYVRYASNYGFGYHSWQPAQMQHHPRVDRYNNNNFFASTGMTPTHNGAYAQESLRQADAATRSHSANHPSRNTHVATPSQGLNYDYHFPPVESTTQRAQSQTTREPSFQQVVEQHLAARAADSATSQAEASGPQPAPDIHASQASAHPQPPPTFRWNAEGAKSSNAEPSNARTKMREHLARLSDQAKERSMSQGNIRTVLHDPFRSDATLAPPVMAPRPEPDTKSVVELKKTVANPSGLPPHLFEDARNESTARAPYNGATAVTTVETINIHSSLESRRSTQRTEATPQISSGSRRLCNSSSSCEDYAGKKMEEPSAKLDQTKCLEQEVGEPAKMSYERRVNDWWLNGSTFARHEELFNRMKAADAAAAGDLLPSNAQNLLAPIGTPARKDSIQETANTTAQQKCDAHTRMLIPVWENLASYVQGPPEKRRDYFSQWTQAPEYAFDRNDNSTFFDNNWGEPPLRYGRNPLHRHDLSESGSSRHGVESVRFGGFSSPTTKVGDSLAVGAGLQGRFAFGRM